MAGHPIAPLLYTATTLHRAELSVQAEQGTVFNEGSRGERASLFPQTPCR